MSNAGEAWRRTASVVALVSGLAAAGESAAQAVTDITPDVAAGVTTGTTVTPAGALITIDGGVAVGGNLFHSFNTFDLAAGDTAAWVYSAGDPSLFGNVINRVTGGSASDIEGIIDSSALPNADFYFINPAGIVFGDGFSANVPGSFFVSTANALSFADGATFRVTTPSGSTLTSAAPAAFGFLGGQSSDVVFRFTAGAPLALDSPTLHLSGANVTFEGVAIERGGAVAHTYITGAGNSAFMLTLPGVVADVPVGAPSGQVRFLGASLLAAPAASAHGAGLTEIEGGTILLQDGSAFVAIQNTGAFDSGDLSLRSAGDVRLVNGASLTTSATGIGDGGRISISAANLVSQTLGGLVETTTTGAGDAGDIAIDVTTSFDGWRLTLQSTTDGAGAAGDIAINAPTAAVTFTSGDIVTGTSGAANAGSITINARTLSLVDTDVASGTTGAGDAGDIYLSGSEQVELIVARVDARSQDFGDAGDVRIVSSAGDVWLERSLIQTVGSGVLPIGSPETHTGLAGAIFVEAAGDLRVLSTTITSQALNHSGRAGAVDLSAGGLVGIEFDLGAPFGFISTLTSSTGAYVPPGVGDPIPGVRISGENVYFNGSGGAPGQFLRITTETQGPQPAGDVRITAAEVLSIWRGSILTQSITPGASGDSGAIILDADDILITASAIGAISSSAGDAGEISISAGDQFLMELDSGITSSSGGTGAAGDIEVHIGGVGHISGLSDISSEAGGGATRAGDVRIIAPNADLTITGYVSEALRSRISANTGNAAEGGNVTIEVASLHVLDGARVLSSSTGSATGDGGNVTVTSAGNVTVEGSGASIQASSFAAGGAGAVDVTAGGTVRVGDGGSIESAVLTAAGGEAGSVDVTGQLVHIDGGRVSTHASSTIAPADPNAPGAGRVRLTGGDIVVENGATVTASTQGMHNAGAVELRATTGSIQLSDSTVESIGASPGGAGQILIDAQTDVRIDATSVTTEAPAANTRRTGAIIIEAGDEVWSSAATITASGVTDELGAPATIQLTGASLTLTNGTSISSTTAGAREAGNIFLTASGAITLNQFTASSLTTASGNAGNVEITADILDVRLGQVSTFSNGVNLGVGEIGGDGGDIVVSARVIDIDNVISWTPSTTTALMALGTSTGTDGDAGRIVMGRSDSIITLRHAELSSGTSGVGDGGDIDILANQLTIIGGGVSSGPVRVNTPVGGVSAATGQGGDITITANVLELGATTPATGPINLGVISASTTGAGNAGAVELNIAQRLTMNEGAIQALTGAEGDAGAVTINAANATITMTNSSILSSTAGSGDAGSVEVRARSLAMSGVNRISSAVESDPIVSGVTDAPSGAAGSVQVIVSENLVMDGFSRVLSSAESEEASGAGSVVVDVGGALDMASMSSISAQSRAVAPGAPAGQVNVTAASIAVRDSAEISTTSHSANAAGDISIEANTLRVDGPGARITSENTSPAGGDAGSITIVADNVVLANGGSVSTDSNSGAAGDITFTLSPSGVMWLRGPLAGPGGVVTTSSGAGTGGRIVINEPLAIITSGGSILALGQAGGANVSLRSGYFIASSDRINTVAVDGVLIIDSQVQDVSSGTEEPELPFLDAGDVLSGRCNAVRESGQASHFARRAPGPYAIERPATPDGRSQTCGASF